MSRSSRKKSKKKTLDKKDIKRLNEAWSEGVRKILQATSDSNVLGEEFSYWWEGLLLEDYMERYRLPGYETGEKIIGLDGTVQVNFDDELVYLEQHI